MFILRSVQVEGLHVGLFPNRDAAEGFAQSLELTDYTIHVVWPSECMDKTDVKV